MNAESPQITMDKTEQVAALLSVLRDTSKVEQTRPFLVLPPEYDTVDVEKFMEAPARVRENHTFVSVDSFIEYIEQFKGGYKPALFAEVDIYNTAAPLSLTCIIDYHEAGDKTAPKWGSHKVHLSLRYDPDFAIWMQRDSKLMPQADFADMVDEYRRLFEKPDSATMLEIAQHLQGARAVNWSAGKRLNNGQVHFEYQEEISAKTSNGALDVPEKFTINTPVFAHLEKYIVESFLRWRLVDGKVLLGYKMIDVRILVEEAIKNVVEKVEEQTELTALYTAKR